MFEIFNRKKKSEQESEQERIAERDRINEIAKQDYLNQKQEWMEKFPIRYRVGDVFGLWVILQEGECVGYSTRQNGGDYDYQFDYLFKCINSMTGQKLSFKQSEIMVLICAGGLEQGVPKKN